MSRQLILTQFGKKAKFVNCQLLIECFRAVCPDVPILLLTDRQLDQAEDVEQRIVDTSFLDHRNKRYGYHASNYFRGWGLLNSDADEAVYLDCDMHIMSPHFVEGFKLARMFGVAIPISDRWQVREDLRVGLDVEVKDRRDMRFPIYGAVWNASPIFYSRYHDLGHKFLMAFLNQYHANPRRGPLGLWRAALESKIAPYVLPIQWCLPKRLAHFRHHIVRHGFWEPS